MKAIRLCKVPFKWAASFGRPKDSSPNINEIESAGGFEAHGDLISHLPFEWPGEREQGYDLSTLPLDEDVLRVIDEFAREMKQKGVHVVISYTPLEESFYQKHRGALEHLHERLSSIEAASLPSPPSAFVYPSEWFFDTVYHLDAAGRPHRSRAVAADLKRLGLVD
jgi:hypothetical protein